MNDLKKKRCQAWGLAALWLGLIYSTIGLVWDAWEFLKTRLPLGLIVNISLILLILTGITIFIPKITRVKRATVILLILIGGTYLGVLFKLKIPAERIHLVEYGLLAYLVFRALILDFRESQACLFALILTALFGWGDEGIQYFIPNRFYQIQDVLLNFYSAGLGLLTTYVIRRGMGQS